jgi:hypothetical protein
MACPLQIVFCGSSLNSYIFHPWNVWMCPRSMPNLRNKRLFATGGCKSMPRCSTPWMFTIQFTPPMRSLMPIGKVEEVWWYLFAKKWAGLCHVMKQKKEGCGFTTSLVNHTSMGLWHLSKLTTWTRIYYTWAPSFPFGPGKQVYGPILIR